MNVRQPTPGEAPLLELDDEVFSAHFDRRPFKITHRLTEHRLFALPRLTQLARDLGTPNAARSIALIETGNTWSALRNVGEDPEYAALLAQLIDELRSPSEYVAPGLSAPRADIFISSPGASAPFHLNEEHHFLLQIRGTKKLAIADGFDPTVIERQSLRAFFNGSGELAPCCECLDRQSVQVDLEPGEGVHIPPCHPHGVQNGPAVSVSLGILWLSDVTASRRQIYRVNSWLERVGLKPKEPGVRPLADLVKALPATAKRRLKRAMGRD